MKTPIPRVCLYLVLFAQSMWLCCLPLVAQTTNEDFSVIGENVVRLLNSGDAAKFAAEVAPKFDDWLAIRSTNLITNGEDPVAGFRQQAERTRKEIETSARQLLERANAVGAGGTGVKYKLRSATSKFVGSTRYPTLQR